VSGNREPGTGNREPGTGNRSRIAGMGNREWEMGNGEWESEPLTSLGGGRCHGLDTIDTHNTEAASAAKDVAPYNTAITTSFASVATSDPPYTRRKASVV
jgi:hypothetical protein